VGVVLLDSSAIVGYIDHDDLLHRSAVKTIESAIRAGSALTISAISWAEVMRGAFSGHRDPAAVRQFVVDFGIEILPVDASVAERAAELQATYADRAWSGGRRRLRTPDTLILATADLEADVEVILAGDDQWRQIRGIQARVKLLREQRD